MGATAEHLSLVTDIVGTARRGIAGVDGECRKMRTVSSGMMKAAFRPPRSSLPRGGAPFQSDRHPAPPRHPCLHASLA